MFYSLLQKWRGIGCPLRFYFYRADGSNRDSYYYINKYGKTVCCLMGHDRISHYTKQDLIDLWKRGILYS
jgi:hypothetical protein